MATPDVAAFDAALKDLQRAYAELLSGSNQQDLAVLSERVGGAAAARGAMMDGIEARIATDRQPTNRWASRITR